ncbi:hypothetical protein [Photobacterium rosenbergii]|uniref:hypothetical protein n=1 Tax=Photobacterium rosenbergii TaxID=294936 RepID=UPI001C99E3D9|nr:hypothetical protein [Photobacterium rosenbergii]MBY5949290.1 hypothetical protein [Photobacterium rosenbergii]
MSLKCRGCGSRTTEVVNAKELSEKTGDSSFITQNQGAIDPNIVAGALKAIFKALGKIFGWLEEREKGNRKVVVCRDCGHWEKV